MKKLLAWAVLLGTAIWLIKNPAAAAADVRHILAAIATFARDL